MPSNAKAAKRNGLIWLAGSPGALAQSPSDASVEEMLPGDLETVRLFRSQVAEQARRLVRYSQRRQLLPGAPQIERAPQ